MRAPSMTGEDEFLFLSVERHVAEAADWNRADWPKLWLYNAHYFDDLVAEGAVARVDWHRALIRRWIAENPPGQGNGWEPYPLSLRIVNWLKWILAGNPPDEGMRLSLAVQARWLRNRLEYHLLGNHLWANAKALIFAGTCFEGDEADAWRSCGLRLMARELDEQVLADGGHFERSPMYHAILTGDLLDLVQLVDRFDVIPATVRDRWRETTRRMLAWAATMAHPDGGPAFFNDTAFGIAPDLPALRSQAAAIAVPDAESARDGAMLLQSSGYARLAIGPALMLADVAPIGPDYLPGHAHADTLSFELSLHGRRVLVNGGTSTYENDAERLRQRGTRAHNTVEIDGQDSSEVWSAFRVARRARVHDIECETLGDALRLSASHDGYRRLPGRVVHHREWLLHGRGLQVTDSLEGRFGVADARYLFAPGEEMRWEVEGGEAKVEPATWHPRFGESVVTRVLAIRFTGPRCRVNFHWD